MQYGEWMHVLRCVLQYSSEHGLRDIAESRAGLKQWWVLIDVSGTAPALKYLVGRRQEREVCVVK